MAYLLRRLLLIVPVLLGASMIVFFMMHLAPGDPALAMLGPLASKPVLEQLRRELGLNRPLYIQYWDWIRLVARGDLGRSIYLKSPVTSEILNRIGPSALLIAASFSFAVFFGTLAGVVSGIYRNSWLDRVIMPLVTLGVSMPSFYLGMVLLVVFAVRLSWLPAGGFMTISATRAEWPDVLQHIVLPAITLGSAPLAVIARTLRTSVLEEVSKHYVRTARAKGLSELRITAIHVFKNALIPMVHLLGLQVGFLLASTALVEVVFGYPGLGDLLIRSIITRDLPLTQGIVLVLTLCYVLINLIADVAHGMLDPRLRHG